MKKTNPQLYWMSILVLFYHAKTTTSILGIKDYPPKNPRIIWKTGFCGWTLFTPVCLNLALLCTWSILQVFDFSEKNAECHSPHLHQSGAPTRITRAGCAIRINTTSGRVPWHAIRELGRLLFYWYLPALVVPSELTQPQVRCPDTHYASWGA